MKLTAVYAALLVLFLFAGCGAPPQAAPDASLGTSQAALTCSSWYQGNCVWWDAELVPNARWCASGEQPGAREVMVWASPNFQAYPYCMVFPVAYHRAGGTKLNDLSLYGWAGPSFWVQSIQFGSAAMGYTYSGDNLTGTYYWWGPGTSNYNAYSFSIQSMGVYY